MLYLKNHIIFGKILKKSRALVSIDSELPPNRNKVHRHLVLRVGFSSFELEKNRLSCQSQLNCHLLDIFKESSMLTIRPATLLEYPKIQQIAHQTWPDTFRDILSPQQITYMLDWMYSLPSLKEQVEVKGHTFLLAEEAENPLGFVSYELNYSGLSKTKIHKIYILPSSQGKGVGKGLINRTSEIAAQNHNSSLLLNVNRYNKAIDFYKRMGFEIVGKEDIDIGNGFLMEDYVLEKNLL